ncbi:MAG TPA: hypothetical protein VMW51_02855 [Terriglobia bacterium]|nr:hypothetical protein [Terriglobia bacterium]
MKILERGPTGKFIGYGEALRVWLPELLDNRGEISALEVMLQTAGKWCGHQAAKRYDMAAETLRAKSGFWEDPTKRAESLAIYAARWFRRKEILERTIEELKKA